MAKLINFNQPNCKILLNKQCFWQQYLRFHFITYKIGSVDLFNSNIFSHERQLRRVNRFNYTYKLSGTNFLNKTNINQILKPFPNQNVHRKELIKFRPYSSFFFGQSFSLISLSHHLTTPSGEWFH